MGWATFWTGVVSQADCDHLGHMNVARYFDCCSNAVFEMQEGINLGQAAVAARRISFAVVTSRADFRSEIRAGESLRHQIAVAEIATRWVRFHHRLFAGDPERLAFEAEFKSVLLNLDTRRAAAIPDDIRSALSALKITEGDEI